MSKRLVFALFTTLVYCQTHTFPAKDTNNTFSGVNQFLQGVKVGPKAFADLPSPDSTMIYCTDCQTTNPCSIGGTGAFAFGSSGVWNCAATSSGGGASAGTPINSFQWNNAGNLSGAVGNSYTPGTGINPGINNIANLNGVITVTADYDFQACVSGCASVISGATTISAGANTVTLTPVPVGINGTNSPHYIQITPVDGTPTEWVKITGGSAVSGAASGTLTFTAGYAHGAGYKLQSASTGIQEAANTLVSPGSMLKLIPHKTYVCNAPIFLPGQNHSLDGQWALITHQSFSSCIVLGKQTGLWGTDSANLSFDIHNIDMRPGITLWTATPTGSIAGGNPTETLTIGTCPAGFYANIPDQLLWLAGTASGKPTTVYGLGEYVMNTGGTCTPGVSNGTIIIRQATPDVTNIAAHDNGFTISNGVGPYIEDALGNGGHIHDMRFASNDGVLLAGNLIQVNNDQSCGIDNMNMGGGFTTRKDAWFQGAGIFAPGAFASNAAICHVGPNVNITGPATCVRWYSGNDFSWTSGICQNYSTGGVIVGNKRGGFGKFTIGQNVHFEVGAVADIWGTGIYLGNPSLLVMGSNKPVDVQTDLGSTTMNTANSSPYPVFLNLAAQTNTMYYYLVAHNNTLAGCTSGGDCVTPPVFIGAAVVTDPSVDNVPVRFFGWGSGQPVTPSIDISSYDLLRVPSGAGTLNLNIPQAPFGTSTYAVATGLAPSAICNIRNVCTITDNVETASLASYVTVTLRTSNKRFYPVAQILPGGIALTAAGPVNSSTVLVSYHGSPACLNAMEFLGNSYVAEFATYSFGSEPDIGNCPIALSPVSFLGGGTSCMTSSACGRSASGSVVIAAGATTVTVTSTAITRWSTFQITENATRGALSGATCNTTLGRTYMVTTLTPGVSFVITASAAPVTNPACLDFRIIN